MAKTKHSDTTRHRGGSAFTRHTGGVSVEKYSHSGKELGSFKKKKKLKIQLPLNPGTVLLGIYPRERIGSVHTKACTQMFLAAL